MKNTHYILLIISSLFLSCTSLVELNSKYDNDDIYGNHNTTQNKQADNTANQSNTSPIMPNNITIIMHKRVLFKFVPIKRNSW